MLRLLSLSKSTLIVRRTGKRSLFTQPLPKKSLRASFVKRARLTDVKRYYCTGKPSDKELDSGIIAVDKWGVQRDAKEMATETTNQKSASSGPNATDLPIFELSRVNFEATLHSTTPVIIMAYMPEYVICSNDIF